MKVMKVIDKKVGNTTYYKYRINLPKEMVEEMDLINKQLRVRNEHNKIIIERRNEDENLPKLTQREKKLRKEMESLFKNKKNVSI